MHIGYLLHRKEEVFFIHSSYYPPVAIVAEIAEISPAFQSQVYVVGEISTNEELVKNWILNDTIGFILKKGL